MAISTLEECKTFTGLRSGQELDSTSGTVWVENVAGNTLRATSGYCMIGSFPCRVKDLSWAAPGKHGSWKLRVVGVGVFDNKKRETIFRTQHPVPVPVVTKLPNVTCLVKPDGLQVVDSDETSRLPPVLSYNGHENCEALHNIDLGAEVRVTASLLIACGHYKITDMQVSEEHTQSTAEHPTHSPTSSADEPTRALSRKETRKLKKLKRQQDNGSQNASTNAYVSL